MVFFLFIKVMVLLIGKMMLNFFVFLLIKMGMCWIKWIINVVFLRELLRKLKEIGLFLMMVLKKLLM